MREASSDCLPPSRDDDAAHVVEGGHEVGQDFSVASRVSVVVMDISSVMSRLRATSAMRWLLFSARLHWLATFSASSLEMVESSLLLDAVSFAAATEWATVAWALWMKVLM